MLESMLQTVTVDSAGGQSYGPIAQVGETNNNAPRAVFVRNVGADGTSPIVLALDAATLTNTNNLSAAFKLMPGQFTFFVLKPGQKLMAAAFNSDVQATLAIAVFDVPFWDPKK